MTLHYISCEKSRFVSIKVFLGFILSKYLSTLKIIVGVENYRWTYSDVSTLIGNKKTPSYLSVFFFAKTNPIATRNNGKEKREVSQVS